MAYVLAGAVLALTTAGCGAESPDDAPAPAPSATATRMATSAMGVTEHASTIDFIDAHLAPASGHRTAVQLTLANTDPAKRHDLVKVTARGASARITAPGGSTGRIPMPAATHVDTLAGQYTITFPFRAPAHGTVPVTFTFTGSGPTTIALPVLKR